MKSRCSIFGKGTVFNFSISSTEYGKFRYLQGLEVTVSRSEDTVINDRSTHIEVLIDLGSTFILAAQCLAR